MRAPSAEPRPHAPPGLPLARPGSAERLGLAGGATRGLCCVRLGRSSGASQRLGRASFTHATTTEMSGPSVEP